MRFLVFFFCVSPCMAQTLPDGALIFLENSHPLVECYTDSTYSHVAIHVGGNVYEAAPPRIAKLSLRKWFTKVAKQNEEQFDRIVLSVLIPVVPYTDVEIAAMQAFLDAQVGRPYSIRGYLREVPGDGIHCSEMCAGAVEAARRLEFSIENFLISPGGLRMLVSSTHKQLGGKITVRLKPHYRRSFGKRVVDWWDDRQQWCRWSCVETWKWCW